MMLRGESKANEIDYQDFSKMDIRIGLIKSCEYIQNSRNFYKFIIDCGESREKQIISGISSYFSPEELIDQKILVLINLKNRKILGFESQGIILAADIDHQPFIIKIGLEKSEKLAPGTKIK